MKLLTMLLCLGLIGCTNGQIKREGEPTIINIQDGDKEMNDAIKKANDTLDEFKNALNGKKAHLQYFALKTRFNTPIGGEHIWVSNIQLKNDKYWGVVDNLPESTSDVKLGDTIQINNNNNISDWMYVDNGKLKGGFTIRVLRNKMTPADRKQFHDENGLIIE
ncbi:MAG TPA: DUF2314 domain-containing protein [Pedobacter sp.]